MFTISFANLNIIFVIPLICVCCCSPWCAIGAGIFWMCNFGVPHERWSITLIPSKAVFLFCFLLSLCSILLLPIDLSVKNIFNDYLATYIYSIITQIFYFVIIFFVVIVIPFFICLYESQNPDGSIITQCCQACCCTCILFISLLVIFIVSYIVLLASPILFTYLTILRTIFGDVFGQVGYQKLTVLTDAAGLSSWERPTQDVFNNYAMEKTYYSLQFIISPVVWFMAVFNFFGWILFSVLGGCGLSSLPIYCLTACCRKPKRIRADVYGKKKAAVLERAKTLMEVGKKLEDLRKKHKIGRKDFLTFKSFRDATIQLEEDWNTLETSFKGAGGNIFRPIFDTCCGVIFAVFSLIWIIHIVLYRGLRIVDDILDQLIPTVVTLIKNVLPIANFTWTWKMPFKLSIGILPTICALADSIVTGDFPVFGAIVFAVFSIYLLVATYMGVIQISTRIPLLNVHPLKSQDTMMHTLLFNQGIVLLCLMPLNQFIVDMFGDYAKGTVIYSIFEDVIMNVRFIGLFFRYIHYLFIAAFVFGFFASIIFFLCPPKSVDEKKLAETLKRLEKRKGNICTNCFLSCTTSCRACIPDCSLPPICQKIIPFKIPCCS